MRSQANTPERLHLAMLLSVLGGIMDGYSYSVRGGVFATGQTGNLIIFAYRFVHGQHALAFRAFVPILGFWLGIFTAQFKGTAGSQPEAQKNGTRWNTMECNGTRWNNRFVI